MSILESEYLTSLATLDWACFSNWRQFYGLS